MVSDPSLDPEGDDPSCWPGMKPWETLGRARLPDGTELTLVRHPSEFAILADGRPLMSSRMHGSEEELARLGCDRARTMPSPCVLVGGLGMGFTLRAALDTLPPTARVLVAELVPAVVEWNRGPLGVLAGHPLDDPRVRIETGDVAATIRSSRGRFDVVLLDVDNGAVAMTAASNAALYSDQGIAAARAAVRPGGILALWSATDDRRFERRLRAAGFDVKRTRIPARLNRGPRHTILIAQRRDNNVSRLGDARVVSSA
jgi:spermidine synthase